ncbi:hemolysin family protein [Candidatus Lucifugimonas marina]|uniref:CBS domain-containing protein n=1 Tax=Candidatus Lucifugimonas marina TaxID=3038979 RepID=A0AAJ6CRM4_9CHLR|nr:CBS domain-containing protein [SAR202 cluster bacterium JH702]MDG0869905.1 CBS domain-containing protein [SAR202 cluster bacterium JH639]WFG34630.1 CBS domain-containing protein [SAR202 cluster bacterium JH545]WFG38558.1 CBS domain-containing protein [SAR202 cluster bacterium JH1073]
MSPEILSLLALIVSGSVFFLTALAISSLGTRINPLPSAVRNPNSNGNGNGDSEHDHDHGFSCRLSAESSLIGRSLQAAALMASALAVFAIFESGSSGSGYDVALSGVITAVGAIVVQLIASGLSGYQRNWARAISRPTGTLLRWTSLVPGISHIVDFSLSRGRGDDAVGEEVSAALQESLDFLEESVIPADQNELRMIRGILRMDTVKVREIMVPRVDMNTASATASIGAVADLMSVGGHSKIPVYNENIDSIAGVIYARDVLSALDNDKDPDGPVESLARPALHVPESQSLERLLRQLQEHRTGLAIVVDEYGGVSGLVTVTDLIEEIVGELIDEFDVDGPEVEAADSREMFADAGASIDIMNQTLGTSVVPDGFDTVGGLVFRELGKMPSPGDTVSTEGVTITVQSVIGRRIRRVKVERDALEISTND